MTDFERDDALDHLSSDELERQAFGPDPDSRRSLRGLIDRPASGEVVYRVKETTRRWPKVVLGMVAGLAVLVTGVAIGVDMERQPDAVVSPLSDAEAEAIEAALEAGTDPMEAQARALEAEAEAAAETIEDAVDEIDEDLGDGGVLSDGPEPGDAVFAD